MTCTVTVCRGGFCGTAKAPRGDHAGQVDHLGRALGGIARVRVSDCLDACGQAKVIVVQPSAAGRQAGGRPVWLGFANDPGVAADIIGWVAAGGPGVAELPAILDLYRIEPGVNG